MELTKLLVANRGEIAIRIMRAAGELGIEAHGVFSADDEDCLHAHRGACAHRLEGSGPSAYLDGAQLLAVAAASGCTAIHPGYGFLSENAEFAEACSAAGVLFIGPTPATLRMLGDKVQAREFARSVGVEVPLGSHGQGRAEPCTEAQAMAFFSGLKEGGAVVLKAAMGGGGRGMRVVRDPGQLSAAFEQCRREALAAFGSDVLYVEQYVQHARHIEVQIMGDGSGQAVHLHERECSAQRRHQKILEIAPAPQLPRGLLSQVLAAAVKLARKAKFRGVGTMEFLVDTAANGFWFIEANPRLQVEHTVTEEVTGVDLVQTQIQLARGATLASLGFSTQEDVPEPRGHAIQLRICAEKVEANGVVTPQQGKISAFECPVGPGIRVDSHGFVGYQNNPQFDSLLGKLVVSHPSGDFEAVLRRAQVALSEFQIGGVGTNRAFLMALLRDPVLASGDLHTSFIDDHVGPLAMRAQGLAAELERAPKSTVNEAPRGPLVAGEQGPVLSGDEFAVVAPMLGTVVSLGVTPGSEVTTGQIVCVLSAMKMEHEVTAARSGVVTALHAAEGDAVAAEQILVVLSPADVVPGTSDEVAVVDLDLIRSDLAEVIERHAVGLDDRRPDAVKKRRKTGHRTARENVADLVDEGTFVEYGALVIAAQRKRRSLEELIAKTPADGLVAGVGCVNGTYFGKEDARCIVMSYDYTVMAGTQGVQNHHKKDRMFELAERQKLPLIFLTEGGGGRPGDTDAMSVSWLDCLAFLYFGKLSGLVPLVGIATGRCFAGNAALFGCCDVTIATDGANIGMGGPAMIEGGGLGVYTPDEVGPVDEQTQNGVVDIRVRDEAEAVVAAKQYLSYFQGVLEEYSCVDQRLLRSVIPEQRLRMYDVRVVIETMMDIGSVLELRRGFGEGMVTALARVEGRPLGIIANNPAHLAGAIDRDGADKASRFMQLCDAHDIPLLMLCDTPGIMVGPESEKNAMVRHASRMFVTASSLTIPFFTIVLRKGYGLGAQLMAGGSFRAPLFIVGFPTSEFGAMGLEGAVKLGFRKELEAVEDIEQRKKMFDKMVEIAYAMGKGVNLAAQFEIDDVIDPADSRKHIVAALESAPAPVRRTGKKRPCIDTW